MSLLNKKAPDFSLMSHKNQKISLKDFHGEPLVILFFPFAFSGVCTEEMCSMRDNLSVYNSLRAKILGISVDSHFTLKNWAESMGLTFELLSDFNKTVAVDYGCLLDVFVPGVYDYKGVAKRSAFVLDKDGIVKYEEILEDARLQPDYSKIVKTLETLN